MIAKLIDNKRTKAQFFRVKTQNIRQVILGNIAVKTHKKINKMRNTNLLNTNTKQYKENIATEIFEMLQGGAIDIPLYYYQITELAKRVHQTEVLTEKETEKIHKNFFNHIGAHCLRLATEYNINYNNLR